MKKIFALTLVVTDQCNFSCSYCPQDKEKKTLRMKDIQAFLEFLRPRLAKEVWLGFYGGEPLLSWPLVEKTVACAEKNYKKKFRFTLTTNGSLLKEEHILFFKEHRFELVLSYDGLAQNRRDANSVVAVETALKSLRRLYPEGYLINSVFTPQTVPLLAASIKEMIRQGHGRLQYALDQTVPWQEMDLDILEQQLERLATACLEHRQKTGKIPLENFIKNTPKGIFACFAGRDRLALLPDRTIWGCDIFHTLLGHDSASSEYDKYCFGTIEEFISMPAKALATVVANYAELRQDYFFSEKKELCGLCDDLESCTVCPAVAALAIGTLAVLPAWICRIRKITRAAAEKLSRVATNI